MKFVLRKNLGITVGLLNLAFGQTIGLVQKIFRRFNVRPQMDLAGRFFGNGQVVAGNHLHGHAQGLGA